MPVAKNAFHTPSIPAASYQVPSFLSCSSFIATDRLDRNNDPRVALTKVKGPTFAPNPCTGPDRIRPAQLLLNYNTGTKTVAGSCISRSALELTQPPLIKCKDSKRQQFPTSYQKSVIPCSFKANGEPESEISVRTPNTPNIPQGNQSDILVKPFPNPCVADSMVDMGTKPVEPYRPQFIGRVLTQRNVSCMNFTQIGISQ